jgi:hypothetical protein
MSNLFRKEIGGRPFNFQPYSLGTETGYHVDVKDEEGTRWEFRMSNPDNSGWTMYAEKLPHWIEEIEAEIIQAIDDHE